MYGESIPPPNLPTPLAEFLAIDNYDVTNEYIAVIRGRDGARSKVMYGPEDPLPEVYLDGFETVIYKDYVKTKRAFNKMAVLASVAHPESFLNHALLQARRRENI